MHICPYRKCINCISNTQKYRDITEEDLKVGNVLYTRATKFPREILMMKTNGRAYAIIFERAPWEHSWTPYLASNATFEKLQRTYIIEKKDDAPK